MTNYTKISYIQPFVCSYRLLEFLNCSFVNYANWVANYSGNNAAVRAVNCAFDAGFTTSVTQVGTNQSSVSFAADYSYTGSANYGHLKKLRIQFPQPLTISFLWKWRLEMIKKN